MNTLRKRLVIGLVALGMSAGSVAAYAERGEHGREGHGGRGHGAQMHSPERMKQHFEKRQARLHEKLKLNASQEQAWKSYQDVIKPTQPPARPDRAEFEKLPAPERMERMYQMMQERQKRMAAHIAATREFYAVLTPEQQKVFDAEFMRGPRHHGGPRGGHGHPGGPGGEQQGQQGQQGQR